MMNLKCFFKGHDWRYVSSNVKQYFRERNDNMPFEIKTTALVLCKRCKKNNQVELDGDIPVSDLIKIWGEL